MNNTFKAIELNKLPEQYRGVATMLSDDCLNVIIIKEIKYFMLTTSVSVCDDAENIRDAAQALITWMEANEIKAIITFDLSEL